MKEYSKGIYVKFKPEEVEILHDRMKRCIFTKCKEGRIEVMENCLLFSDYQNAW